MVKKFLYTLINTVSLLIIVAAVAVLVLVSRPGAWSRRMRLIR